MLPHLHTIADCEAGGHRYAADTAFGGHRKETKHWWEHICVTMQNNATTTAGAGKNKGMECGTLPVGAPKLPLHTGCPISMRMLHWAKECSDHVSNVRWHLLDLSVVIFLDVLHCTSVVVSDEIDGNSLTAKATAAADAVQIVLHVLWQIVVDDERHLLHINTTGEKIGGDQNTG